MQSQAFVHWLENHGSPLGVNRDQRRVPEIERGWRSFCARGTIVLPSGGSTSQLTLGRSPLERARRALCARRTVVLPTGGSTSQLTLGRSPGPG